MCALTGVQCSLLGLPLATGRHRDDNPHCLQKRVKKEIVMETDRERLTSNIERDYNFKRESKANRKKHFKV